MSGSAPKPHMVKGGAFAGVADSRVCDAWIKGVRSPLIDLDGCG